MKLLKNHNGLYLAPRNCRRPVDSCSKLSGFNLTQIFSILGGRVVFVYFGYWIDVLAIEFLLSVALVGQVSLKNAKN